MRRRRRNPAPSALPDLLRAIYPAPDQLDAARVFSFWWRELPERVVRNARPVGVERGVLTVHVSTSVWANELQLLAPELLRRLHDRLPSARIRRMRFRIATLPPLPERPVIRDRRPTPLALSELPEALARDLARLDDDALRETIARAARSSLGRLVEPPTR
ncbi:MAG: DUF721 domain-containing protein [Myxococcales bacterium]|nr:DUF721 domain-containing protein [Myxococcales bacterium]